MGEKFDAGWTALVEVKRLLRTYLTANLDRLNKELGRRYFSVVNVPYRGVYQWNLELKGAKAGFLVSFGSSAWMEVEHDPSSVWKTVVADPDYSRLLIGSYEQGELRQSSVSISDVLAGLTPENNSLVEEIIAAARGV